MLSSYTILCSTSFLKTDRQTKTLILKLWSNYMTYERKTTYRIVYRYRIVPISANGSRQRLFLAILFHISKRAWHALVNNLLFFHMQVRFLYSHFPSAPWKPKYKGPMRPHFRTPVPNSTNAIRSVKFTYKGVKETLLCV